MYQIIAEETVFNRQGTSDKFYRVRIYQWVASDSGEQPPPSGAEYRVEAAWGRRGCSPQGSSFIHNSSNLESSCAAAQERLGRKVRRGYTANRDGVTREMPRSLREVATIAARAPRREDDSQSDQRVPRVTRAPRRQTREETVKKRSEELRRKALEDDKYGSPRQQMDLDDESDDVGFSSRRVMDMGEG